MKPGPARPQAVKVFGILNLVFAGLGALGIAMTYMMYFTDLEVGGKRDLAIEIAHRSSAFMTFMRVSFATGLLARIVLVFAGIGLLRMKTWGRTLTITYGVYGVISAGVSFIMTQRYLAGPLLDSGESMAKAGAAGNIIGSAMGLAYPVLLLIFMYKRDIREAFEKNR